MTIHIHFLKAAGPMLNKLVEEFKIIPATISVVCVILIAVAYLYWDRGSVRDQLVSLQYTMRSDHLDTRLHAVQTEEFNLQQHIISNQEKRELVDPLYADRLDKLKHQEQKLLRRIAELDAAYDKVNVPDKEKEGDLNVSD